MATEPAGSPAKADAAFDSLTAAATRAAEQLNAERRSTPSRVSEALRDLITQGDLPPGTPLRELSLSQTLGVSRNTVREALRLLGHEGLVDYHIHRGVSVKRLTDEDVRALYRTREALELIAIDYSTGAPLEALEEISAIVSRAEAAATTSDWKEVATLDILFHQRIVQLIGSEHIETFFRRIVAELRLGFAAIEPSKHNRFVSWNRLLADLLLAGDVDRCRDEMRLYLLAAEEMICEALALRLPTVDGNANADPTPESR
jgi:DNA-binding GntR family transcriptional regulator